MHTLGNMKLPPFPCFLSCPHNLQHLLAHRKFELYSEKSSTSAHQSLNVTSIDSLPHLKPLWNFLFKMPAFYVLIIILTADDPVLYFSETVSTCPCRSYLDEKCVFQATMWFTHILLVVFMNILP